jgi:hypothetical protein
MRRSVFSLPAALTVVVSAPHVYAQQRHARSSGPGAGEAATAPSPPGEAPRHVVSVTFSPLHLITPIFELTVEASLIPGLGAALILGAGQVTVDDTDPATGAEEEVTLAAYEAGIQAAWYPLDRFDGLQFGAEILYLHINADDIHGEVSGAGDGLAMGPFVGYKVMLDVGFTFVPQLGVQYVTARAEAEDSTGNSTEDTASTWIPLLNLNVGWSF